MQVILSLTDMGFFDCFDCLFNTDQANSYLKRATSKESLSVQMTFSKSQTTMIKDDCRSKQEKAIDFQKGYKYINIDWDKYMMRKDGSPFYYGDYIEE